MNQFPITSSNTPAGGSNPVSVKGSWLQVLFVAAISTAMTAAGLMLGMTQKLTLHRQADGLVQAGREVRFVAGMHLFRHDRLSDVREAFIESGARINPKSQTGSANRRHQRLGLRSDKGQLNWDRSSDYAAVSAFLREPASEPLTIVETPPLWRSLLGSPLLIIGALGLIASLRDAIKVAPGLPFKPPAVSGVSGPQGSRSRAQKGRGKTAMTRRRSSTARAGRGAGIPIFGWCLALAGAFCFASVLHNYAMAALFGEPAEGVIESVEEVKTYRAATDSRPSGASKSNFFIVRYTPKDSMEQVNIRTRQTFNQPFEIGLKVPIRYIPQDPSHAKIATPVQLYLPMLVGFLFSAALLFPGWMLIRKSRAGGG